MVAFRLAVLVVLTGGSLALAQGTGGDVARDVRRFYECTADRAIWLDTNGRPTRHAYRALSSLERADEDGLHPADYRAVSLRREAEALEHLEPYAAVEAAAFDVGLTTSVLKYFRELHLGRVEPRTLGFHLDHALQSHDFVVELQRAIREDAFDRVVDGLRPPFVQYRELKRALQGYRPQNPARAEQIALAMERLRWLPDLAGKPLLVVNIPMFYLWGWDAERSSGVPAIEMPVIIGRAAATRTPVFPAAVNSVIVNPEWNVPDSIVRNEILPALKKDPGYLTRHYMEMIPTGGLPRVRQRPGPWNALGRLKFDLPNPFDVYLHDTPAPALFSRERRDFSHGCVRVARPMELAEWVLGRESGWDRGRIQAAIDAGTTRVIRLPRPVPVVVFYMTAAYDPETGEVKFADDVYGHDARLATHLSARREGGE